jgi:glutamine amidotransferase
MAIIVIVDYGMANLGSIRNMYHRLGIAAEISGDPAIIAKADRLILPGVGAFDVGMRNLRERGLIAPLAAKVLVDRTPLLGICLGMQLLSLKSEEGELPGLGWVEAETVRFRFQNLAVPPKVPHMGWNEVQSRRACPPLAGLHEHGRFYFVHSYHVRCRHPEDVWLTCQYHEEFTAAFQRGNLLGVQFHPEKSHKYGMRLLDSFARWS